MTDFIGRNGYPQPEIVAIATGKPSAIASSAAMAACPAAMAAADCFDIKFGSVLEQSSSVSVVDLTNLDTIAETVEM